MSENNYNSLIPPDNETSKYDQNNFNSNQYNVTQNEMTLQYDEGKHEIWCGCIIPYSVFVVLLSISTVVSIILNVGFYAFSFAAFALIIVIVVFLVLLLRIKKINLIRNESYNQLTVKQINFLNCARSTLNFNLQNVILDIVKHKPRHDEDQSYDALVISNTFKNGTDIDLTLSNIKNKPIKNPYHLFTDIKQNTYNSISLRNFLGISHEIENPVNFDINKYMGKSSDKLSTFSYYDLSKCMKMSDHFYSYYFNEPCCYTKGLNGFKLIIITVPIAIFFVSIHLLALLFASNADIVVNVVLLIVWFTIPFLIILFNIISITKYSLRMDIIYSNNFDIIFIALLNHNGSSYKKTFIHNIYSIEKFIFEDYNNSNDKSILKVVYKDTTIEDIFRIDESKCNLDGLLFILNEKIKNYQQV